MDGRQPRAPEKMPQSHPAQEQRQPSPLSGLTVAWGQPDTQSSPQQGPQTQTQTQTQVQTQDWVSEPPEHRRPSRHWSISIDERRLLAAQGSRERRDAIGAPSQVRDIAQMVAELVSENVDKDVLLPHPPRSVESTNAFHDFLARSTPFWQNATLEDQDSQSPSS